MLNMSKTSAPMVNANVERLRDQLDAARRAIREEGYSHGWERGYAAAVEDLQSGILVGATQELEVSSVPTTSTEEEPAEPAEPAEPGAEVVRRRRQVFARGELQSRVMDAVYKAGEEGLAIPQFLLNNRDAPRESVNHCIKRLLKQRQLVKDNNDRLKIGPDVGKYADSARDMDLETSGSEGK
jgi:hypothetical protein